MALRFHLTHSPVKPSRLPFRITADPPFCRNCGAIEGSNEAIGACHRTATVKKPFLAPCHKVSFAYSRLFGEPMPLGMSYSEAASEIVRELGLEGARGFILCESHDTLSAPIKERA